MITSLLDDVDGASGIALAVVKPAKATKAAAAINVFMRFPLVSAEWRIHAGVQRWQEYENVIVGDWFIIASQRSNFGVKQFR